MRKDRRWKVFSKSSGVLHSAWTEADCNFTQLLLALFRILEPASGTIFIDGVDITKIGLLDCMFVLPDLLLSNDLCSYAATQ